MYKSLLPPNATQLEQDIEQITAAKYDMPVPVADTWNVNTCPAHLLPWLAWAVSVDHWNSAWSDEVKRKAIQASIHTHQIKGTVAAVRQALAALNVRIEITEWFETGDAPGTFGLLAWVNNNLGNQGVMLSPALYADLSRSVKEASPASRHFTLTVGAQFKDTLALAAGALRVLQVKREPANSRQAALVSSGHIKMSCHAHIYQVARSTGAY